MDLELNKGQFVGEKKRQLEGEAYQIPVVACQEQKCQQFVGFDLAAQAV